MIVYVLRHAEAVEARRGLQDEWRYLTEEGRAAAARVGAALARIGRKPRLTVTSPLTRAVQTAEIVARRACRKNRIVASELLAPGADVDALIEFLKSCTTAKRVLLVGHEPQLGRLLAALLDRPDAAIEPKKASCTALTLDPENDRPATFLWYLVPGKKIRTSLQKAFALG